MCRGCDDTLTLHTFCIYFDVRVCVSNMPREDLLLPVIDQEKEGGAFVVRLDGVIRHKCDTRGGALRFAQYYLLRHEITHTDSYYYVKTSTTGMDTKSFVSSKDAVDFVLKRNAQEARAGRNRVIQRDCIDHVHTLVMPA